MAISSFFLISTNSPGPFSYNITEKSSFSFPGSISSTITSNFFSFSSGFIMYKISSVEYRVLETFVSPPYLMVRYFLDFTFEL